jgi:hypothetical protein
LKRTKQLMYDVIAAREKACSRALAEYVWTYRSVQAFHGHVHSSQKGSAREGATRIRNIGYFRRHQTVFALTDGLDLFINTHDQDER